MRNRYYLVGAPIEDLKGASIFSNTVHLPKEYTTEELERLSFYKQDKIRVFTSYSEARDYAFGLREKTHAYTWWPKTRVSNSKVNPVFTVELNPDLSLGDLQTEEFTYKEFYNRFSQGNKQEEKIITITLHFYEVLSRNINNTDIIRAEFDSPLQVKMNPVEFKQKSQKNSCVIS